MTTLLFFCAACLTGQEVACAAVGFDCTPSGHWTAHCTCPACGTVTVMRIDHRAVAEVLYWQQVDAAAYDLSDDDLASLGAHTAAQAEDYLRRAADA